MKKYRHHSLEYKQKIIAEIESGQRSKSVIAREENISPSLIERWYNQFQQGTLREHPSRREKQLEKELDRYKKKVGELTLTIDLLKKIADRSVRMRKSNSLVVTEKNVVRLRKGVN